MSRRAGLKREIGSGTRAAALAAIAASGLFGTTVHADGTGTVAPDAEPVVAVGLAPVPPVAPDAEPVVAVGLAPVPPVAPDAEPVVAVGLAPVPPVARPGGPDWQASAAAAVLAALASADAAIDQLARRL